MPPPFRARTCRRRRSARSAAPVGEPPAGSRVTASVSAPASTLPRSATVPLPPGRRPSERGAPAVGTAQSSSARSGWIDDRHDRPASPGVERSPLMLATSVAGGVAPGVVPVGARTTTIGGGTGVGLASSTARPIAATLANAARPRQNGEPVPRRRRAPSASPPPIRSEMRRQTVARRLHRRDRRGERHQPLFPGAGRFAQHRMRRQQALEAAPRRAAQRAGGVLRGEAVGELGAAVVHGQAAPAPSRITAPCRQLLSASSARRTHDLTVPSGWRSCSATSAWLRPW